MQVPLPIFVVVVTVLLASIGYSSVAREAPNRRTGGLLAPQRLRGFGQGRIVLTRGRWLLLDVHPHPRPAPLEFDTHHARNSVNWQHGGRLMKHLDLCPDLQIAIVSGKICTVRGNIIRLTALLRSFGTQRQSKPNGHLLGLTCLPAALTPALVYIPGHLAHCHYRLHYYVAGAEAHEKLFKPPVKEFLPLLFHTVFDVPENLVVVLLVHRTPVSVLFKKRVREVLQYVRIQHPGDAKEV